VASIKRQTLADLLKFCHLAKQFRRCHLANIKRYIPKPAANCPLKILVLAAGTRNATRSLTRQSIASVYMYCMSRSRPTIPHRGSAPSRRLSRPAPLPIAAALAIAISAVPGTAGATTPSDGTKPAARTARTVSLTETGRLHSTSGTGSTIDERGQATGTYNCAITVHLTILSANRVTAAFTVNPRGGTISGTGSARFQTKGANGYFGGTISIAHGTGSYRHASGTNIGISGVINRETFDLTVHVHGAIHV
jgi:hypothetical protein